MTVSTVWVSSECPDVRGGGGQRRQYHLIKVLLEHGIDVEVVVPRTDQDRRSIEQLTATTVIAPPSGRFRSRRRGPADAVVEERRPDAVLVAHEESLALVPATIRHSHPPLFTDLHNVNSRWFTSRGEHRAAASAARVERRALARGPVVTCSDEERAAALELDATADVMVVRQGFDPTEWPDPPAPPEDPHLVVFFGSLWYPVNVDGLRWFVDEVWPLVTSARPAARLHAFGVAPDDLAVALGGAVEVRGWVPDLAHEVQRAACIVLPILAGPGSRVKFPEALASGIPVVATTTAGESFGAGEVHWAADAPADLASACLDVLDRPAAARRRAAAARQLALRTMTWTAAAEPLLDRLSALDA